MAASPPVGPARADDFDLSLLNRWQRDLPLLPEPYAAIGAAHGSDGATVLAALRRLLRSGRLARVGAVLAPFAFGASTLAALRLPPRRLEAVARRVSALPEVNHNYAREHAYNLWFVLTAPGRAQIERALARIAALADCAPLELPMLEGYHLDLGFDLGAGAAARGAPCALAPRVAQTLQPAQQRLLAALEAGLPLVARPYAALARAAGLDEAAVLAQLQDWLADGALRRLGLVVRHHELGLRANAMCVWDVADLQAAALGRRLAEQPGVNLCYRRARVPGRWRYNLFCMIHGRSREAALALRSRAAEAAGLHGLPGAVLFSRQRYKQCGARYAAGAT